MHVILTLNKGYLRLSNKDIVGVPVRDRLLYVRHFGGATEPTIYRIVDRTRSFHSAIVRAERNSKYIAHDRQRLEGSHVRQNF